MRRGSPARTRGLYFEKPGEQIMTTRSANRPGDWILTSVLWMTGIFLVAPALFGAPANAAANPSAYVTNAGNNTVSVIATASNTVVATIPVGACPTGVAITPDGTHAYVTNFNDSTVSVIATTNNAVVATIPVGNGPAPGALGAEPIGVAITPDGTHAYVTNDVGGTAAVIATPSRNSP